MLRHAGRLALRILIVAGAYYAAGRLSNLLAIPPAYASAVWPAAGIALAAVILWGHWVLPGVLAGAAATSIVHSAAGPGVAISIAVGATAQAAAGAWIARRMAGPGNPLDGGGSVLSTLFVAGPVSCMINATWGVTTLVVASPERVESAAFEWATWWAGDTIGVLLFLPGLLVWSAKPAETWRVRRWTLTAPLVACFVLVVSLFYYSSTAENRRMRSEFQFRQRPISAAIVREIERATSAVVALASFFRASEVVESDEFETFAQETLDQRPGVRALEWGPLVRRSDRAETEFKARARGAEGFEITELDGSGTLVRAGDRDRYFPVTYVQPREENASALGYDLASDPIRSTTIRAAIAEGVPTVTERIRLVQDSNTKWSVLILVPVYAHGSRPPATIEERQHRIEGLTIGVLNLKTLVEQAIKRLDDTGLVIEVLDLSAKGDAQRLYGEQAPHPAIDPESLLWSEAGRQWEIRVGSSGPPKRIWSAWYVLAGGLIFTGLFGAFLLELATRQIHIERLVALRTRELARANDELQRSNLELQRFAHVASHDLREPLRTIGSYAQLLDESATELEPEHRKLLERVVAAARRMQALVDDLLALSRVEGSAAARVSIPLERLVELALENLKPAIDAAHAHIEVGELPTVTCDSSQIVQLLQNLIANAVKFHREGMAPYITIHCRKVGSTFEIAVKDNGIGIAPEHHEKVFEMFERLHGREQYGGTGIGLAICRRIVDRHGGRIWLESSTEGGSVFRFTLPAEGEWG